MLKLIKALFLSYMSFILVVAIRVLLKIRSIISSFPGGEGNKVLLNALYWRESFCIVNSSVFYELVLNLKK